MTWLAKKPTWLTRDPSDPTTPELLSSVAVIEGRAGGVGKS